MWTYKQSTGEMLNADGKTVAIGYSGHLQGKNNPDLQAQHDVGPIPRGQWSILGPPVDTTSHGPFVLHLHPDANTNCFGRSGFLIHGDSVVHPGMASLGCIILLRAAREQIWQSKDHKLQVVQ
jgi:hypothetical protein